MSLSWQLSGSRPICSARQWQKAARTLQPAPACIRSSRHLQQQGAPSAAGSCLPLGNSHTKQQQQQRCLVPLAAATADSPELHQAGSGPGTAAPVAAPPHNPLQVPPWLAGFAQYRSLNCGHLTSLHACSGRATAFACCGQVDAQRGDIHSFSMQHCSLTTLRQPRHSLRHLLFHTAV